MLTTHLLNAICRGLLQMIAFAISLKQILSCRIECSNNVYGVYVHFATLLIMLTEPSQSQPAIAPNLLEANNQNQNAGRRPPIPLPLISFIFVVFMWIFVGISFIIGWRMWWNSPIHPSFALFGAVAFSSVIAFAIVLGLDIVTGTNLSFEFAGLKFTGTSGPVTLWILAFAAIMSTFVLGDFKTLSQSPAAPSPPLQNLRMIPESCKETVVAPVMR
jgi:hypothetical protein